MKRLWQPDELRDQWTLQYEEWAVINETYPAKNKLGLAILLKFFHNEGRFPDHKQEIPKAIVEFQTVPLAWASHPTTPHSRPGMGRDSQSNRPRRKKLESVAGRERVASSTTDGSA